MPPFINNANVNEFYNSLPLPGFGQVSNPTLEKIGSFAQKLAPTGKSIQKSYRFVVSFFPNDQIKQKPDLYARVGPMPLIRAFHVQAVSIPQYGFKKETQFYGPAPRSFPILEHDGFEVRIDFEEDERGTIGNLINWFQRLTIEPENGLYTPPDYVKLPLIGIVTETDIGMPIAVYSLHDAFYLNATGPDLSYTDNTSIKYSITFNVDIINSFFPQSAVFSQLTQFLL